MKLNLRIANVAKQDLRDIWRGLAEFSGLDRADSQLRLVEKKFRLLCQFPESGRQRPELQSELRSLTVDKLVIFYRITEEAIEIVRVLDGRRDIENIFQDSESS